MLGVTTAQLCTPIIPGVGVIKIPAVDVAKDASVAVTVVNADLSRWVAASVLFGRIWFTP